MKHSHMGTVVCITVRKEYCIKRTIVRIKFAEDDDSESENEHRNKLLVGLGAQVTAEPHV